MKGGAYFSPCGRHRYSLLREWDASKPRMVFCGLNPSTADASTDDPTIRREIAFARSWGFGSMVKVNAYGWRSTDPKGLWTTPDPIGPRNPEFVLEWALQAKLFVACWGTNIRLRDADQLRRDLAAEGVKVYALKLTKEGHPQHPLYLPASTMPFRWPGGQPWSPPEGA